MTFIYRFLVLIVWLQLTQATSLTPDKIPTPLKPWVDWVLLDEHQSTCPFLNDRYEEKYCAWPSGLILELSSQQGQFLSHWQVYQESWVTLPGSDKHWPVNVRANDQPIQVMTRYGKPSIKLPRGRYTLKGQLLWDAIPESLSIPANSGLITLSINGKPIVSPAIKKNSIWLKESDRGSKKRKNIQNKLDIHVFRQVNDDIPLQLITYLELEVSGHQREIKLPYALLKNFIPIRLQSVLPARIEPDGSLSVQVRPGRWHIELHARYPNPLDELSLTIQDKNWPMTEIWVFKAKTTQRIVEIQNLSPIDPSQTNLPTAWKKYPAYLLTQGDVMGFKTTQRGDPEPEPNKLQLRRELWLDFDGKGYTIQDKINGKMTHNWRLNALPETELGQVKLNGNNQLITQLKNSKQQGVEIREGNLILKADSRFKGDIHHLSAVGWQQKFHHVRVELNLPPGWRLFAATGVDNVPSSWISQWTLLDLFLVLITALAISRLWNIPWGIFALLTLVLIWHETDAPQFIWLNIIMAIALIQMLPTGRLLTILRGYRYLCAILLVMMALPFLVEQVRKGLYPQLEMPWKQITSQIPKPNLIPDPDNKQSEEAQIIATPQAKRIINKARNIDKSDYLNFSNSVSTQLKQDYLKKSVNFNRTDPNAIVQTGLGAPQWHWNKIKLSWNGTVGSEQQINLWLLTPTMTLVLNIIRVISISLLTLLMLGLNKKNPFKLLSPLPHSPLMLGLCLLVLSSFPQTKLMASPVADYPSSQLLTKLKERLLQAPECVPRCAEISTMTLTIDDQTMQIRLEIHSQQQVAIPLPARYRQWFPHQVRVNGQQAVALLRDDNGLLWLNLTAGIHVIELEGIVLTHKKFTLPLPLKPHYVSLNTKNWQVEGLHEHGIVDDQLQFTSVKNNIEQPELHALEQEVLPPFIQVERILELGLDWRLKTRVTRLVNNDAAVVLEWPLLKGESVITPAIRVKKGKVQVNMSVNNTQFQWESRLEKSSKIELIATDTKRWTEIWKLDASPIWHIQTEGIAVVHHQDLQHHWLPEWRPWRGEKVTLHVIRPQGIKGRSLTIDNSHLILKPGQRSQEISVELSLRSSKGTQHTLILPNHAELQSVLINQVSEPIRQKGRKITLPIKPGKQHIKINWQQNTGLDIIYQTPQINLGLDSVNTHLTINLGLNRWVLYTTGPDFGPVVLFWGSLLVLIVIAFGLGKITWTPLKHWQWFLLLLGLSQIPVPGLLLVIAWLIALGFRTQKSALPRHYFNAMQIGLVMLSIISLLLLFLTVKQGLLGSPDMQIAGNHSTTYALKWYQDRSSDWLPNATVISVPLMVYRLLMLMWSLWLAVSLLNWLTWGWGCFSTGTLWKKNQANPPQDS